MNTLLSIIVSMATVICSLFGIVQKDPVLPSESNNFIPSVRFVVCSDTHVNDSYVNGVRKGRITKMFNVAYDFAKKDGSYKKLDAAMFVGDCADNGTKEQYSLFQKEINAGIKKDTQILAIAAQNHDGYIGSECLESISNITGLDSDFHVVINGFHFIGISTSENENLRYDLGQRKWLRKQLEVASADDPKKPIFVCSHEHVLDTVYGSTAYDQWGTPYFTDILSEYPQVVHFSGHSHYPLNDPRSVKQGKFTTVGTGSMSYAEFRYNANIKIRPDDNYTMAQAWIVEADNNNNVRLTGVDVNDGGILCQYVIPAICSEGEKVFTDENMEKISTPPEFSSKALLKAKDNNDGTYEITSPSANSTDGRIVFAYRIRVYNKIGTQIHTEYIINNYYLSKPYKIIKFNVKAKPGYKVEVTAENAYYMSSNPLTLTIT